MIHISIKSTIQQVVDAAILCDQNIMVEIHKKTLMQICYIFRNF